MLADLQGELTTAGFFRFHGHRFQQPLANSLTAMRGQHGQVMNIDQRPGCEGGKPSEADRDTDGTRPA